MDLGLAGKKALISGSTAGIGFAIASRLAAEQSEVIISGRTEQRVDRAIQEIKRQFPGARVSGIPGDLSRPEVALAVTDRFPDLDIVVNNLGIFEVRPFPEITDEEWERVLQANLFSGIRLGRYYLPRMLSRNQGRIIFISSESALNIPKEMIHYGVTKTAQAALARGMAELTVGSKVTVNTILAGPTLSEGAEGFIGGLAAQQKISAAEVERRFFAEARPSSLLKRFIQPDEVADLVAFVASDRGSAINGAALRVDGGVVRSVF
jgi:NAD(P)-dependent dehydrogenase (short-subunit alcohol dehydrogenase family)